MKIRKFNENIGDFNKKPAITAQVESSVVKLFEDLSKTHTDIDQKWIADRFNDNEVKDLINYLTNKLIEISR